MFQDSMLTVQVKLEIFAVNILSSGLYGKELSPLSVTKLGQLYSLIKLYGHVSQG